MPNLSLPQLLTLMELAHAHLQQIQYDLEEGEKLRRPESVLREDRQFVLEASQLVQDLGHTLVTLPDGSQAHLSAAYEAECQRRMDEFNKSLRKGHK